MYTASPHEASETKVPAGKQGSLTPAPVLSVADFVTSSAANFDLPERRTPLLEHSLNKVGARPQTWNQFQGYAINGCNAHRSWLMRLDSSYRGKYVPIPMQRSADEVQDVDMQSDTESMPSGPNLMKGSTS